MKKSFSFLAPVVVLTVSACTATTPQQQPSAPTLEQTKSTLNVYDDNRVSMRTGRVYVWMSDKSKILALDAGGQFYNIKDLRTIDPQPNGSSYPVNAVLKFANGDQRVVGYAGMRWLMCEISKKCFLPDPGFVRSLPLADLQNPTPLLDGRSKRLDSRKPFMEDGHAYPTLKAGYETFEVDSNAVVLRDMAVADSVVADWQAGASEREIAKRAVEKAAGDATRTEKERIRAALRGAQLGTQTLCSTTTARSGDAMRGYYELNCPGYGISSQDEMLELGWNATNVNTRAVTDSVDGMRLYAHNVTFQKVR